MGLHLRQSPLESRTTLSDLFRSSIITAHLVGLSSAPTRQIDSRMLLWLVHFVFSAKYQKAMLAIAAVLAMIIFVFADLFTSSFSSPGGSSSPEVNVTSWDGGALKSNELEYLVQRRLFVGQFVYQIARLGAGRVVEDGGTPQYPAIPDFGLSRQQIDASISAIYKQCAYTKLFSELASEAGIAVSDRQINRYLKDVSCDKLSNQEIISLLPGNRAQAETRLFKGLRDLLLEQYYTSSISSAAFSIIPEQRWANWKKVNERIAVEAAILPTAKFVSLVSEPSEDEIREYYDQYKNIDPDIEYSVQGKGMPSPTPGFREPRKVKLQFLLGDVSSRSLAYLESVTEEEIVDFYERNKRSLYVDPYGAPAEKSSPTGESSEADSTDEVSEVDTESAATGEEESNTEDNESSAPDESDESEESSDDSIDVVLSEDTEQDGSSTGGPEPTEEPGPTEQDEEETTKATNTEETPVEEVEGDTEAVESQEDTEVQSSQKVSRSPFRLVALQSEDDEATNETSDDSESSSEKTDDDEEGEADEASSTMQETEDDPSYIPLEIVRERIRNRLATEKAVIELKPLVDKAMARLEKGYRDSIEEIAKAEEAGEAPPEPQFSKDMKSLAKELELVHNETAPLTIRQLADTSVGKARDAQRQVVSVARACRDNLSMYEPFQARDTDGNWYIVLKVVDQAERVPALEDIRNKVVQAWQKEQASKLALEKAQEYARELEESGDSMKVFFAGKPYETETTDMFSWQTFGSTPSPSGIQLPQLGDAPPLTAVGDDFMAKAFALEDRKVDAVLNYDETSAFVLRLADREQDTDELKEEFLQEVNLMTPTNVSLIRTQQLVSRQKVLSDLLERFNFDNEKLDAYIESKVK